ncbi:hypothetical protein RhiirA5_401425 [Rhizophagus irregularis]|uniref:Uncharacterized protein n=3 Tax=Rhizophagus irregularis TaxID=588596 RepID=U9TB97_RHIID|nr:hypothetical protein GLOIN_2v1877656 [Rhizophagus irregularis DAOM 181602=DAOM 197198]EXX57918.1 hypothetical protein RirG_202680 [Rhizophagus irregularis DAOM 197198w]PKC04469.1 hypothetical protein RhiirA5_401425 [Rhizophagus irregularis]PKC56487.1 hypothetical protein RhiirA1_500765 [Rhizophagus irregularis]PKY24075.1 hypothetical protein RhiirB3_471802 [Rhizophagus irregularis]POG69303.1 hypothetical protein GLOIN_2v1877656 [Rhizophagus irregularis DAOM 181602=DAOM 197198]|eukprot:XP_025176169.1 hypothetical protein GLOIN_2v1877656 [Rhizophagus irregularis DAOM 181602=DAOM 197198]
METLCNELKVEIFRYVLTPIALVLLNRNWYSTSQDPHARAEWIIYKYGRAHALFHAIRLGNHFVTVEVVQILLAKKAIISRYFMQRLMIQFGTYDPKLIEMRSRYNINTDIPKEKPWASELPLPIFIKLLAEASNELDDIAIRGNDLELFHYLTAGALTINQAPAVLLENLKNIEDLILNKKFIPFPPRPKDTPAYKSPSGGATENYPSRDGYENNRQVNLISRAILIHPDLVILWKKIGYNEICSDFNELVVEGTLLVCFPPSPPNNWVCPSTEIIIEKLQKLFKLGFRLTDKIIEDSIKLFESRINVVGESLLNSFNKLQGDSTPPIVESTLIEIRKPVKKTRKRQRRT